MGNETFYGDGLTTTLRVQSVKTIFNLKPFLRNFRRKAPSKANRAVLNTNSKKHFRKITGLLTVKIAYLNATHGI